MAQSKNAQLETLRLLGDRKSKLPLAEEEQAQVDELNKLGKPGDSSITEALKTNLITSGKNIIGGISESLGNATNSDALKGIGESIRRDNEITDSEMTTGTQQRLQEGWFENGFNGTKAAAFVGQMIPAIIPVLGVAGKAASVAKIAKASEAVITGASVGAGALVGGAMGGGLAAQETRQTLLNDINNNAGLTPEQITQKTIEAEQAARKSNLESFAINAAGTAASVGLGQKFAKLGSKITQGTAANGAKTIAVEGTQGGLKAGAIAAAADLPFNAGQGLLEEAIQSNNTGKEYRTKNALDNVIGGTLGGTAISASIGSNFKVKSIPLTEEGAQNRIKFLTEREPNKKFEMLEVSPGKFVATEKVITPETELSQVVKNPENLTEAVADTKVETPAPKTTVEDQFNYKAPETDISNLNLDEIAALRTVADKATADKTAKEQADAELQVKKDKYENRRSEYNAKIAEEEATLQAKKDKYEAKKAEYKSKIDLEEEFDKITQSMKKTEEAKTIDKNNLELPAIKENLPSGKEIDNSDVSKRLNSIKREPIPEKTPEITGNKAGDTVKIGNKDHVLTEEQARDYNDLNAAYVKNKTSSNDLGRLSKLAPEENLKANKAEFEFNKRFITGNLPKEEVANLSPEKLRNYQKANPDVKIGNAVGDIVRIGGKDHVLTENQVKAYNDLNTAYEKSKSSDKKPNKMELEYNKKLVTGNLSKKEVSNLSPEKLAEYRKDYPEIVKDPKIKEVKVKEKAPEEPIAKKSVEEVNKEVEGLRQATDDEGNKLNNVVQQTQDDLLNKYTSLSREKKVFNRSARNFSDQVLIAADEQGNKHMAFGTTIRSGNKEKLITDIKNFKETDNFEIRRMPEVKDEDGRTFEHAIGIYRNGEFVGYMADEMARTVAGSIDSGNLSNIKTKFVLEPIPRGDKNKRADATVSVNGKKYRPVVAVSGKFDQPIKSLNSKADLKNTATNYANKPKSDTTERIAKFSSPEHEALAKEIFDTYSDVMNIAIKDGDNLHESGDFINQLKEIAEKDFDKVHGAYSFEAKTAYANFDSIKANMNDPTSTVHNLNFNDAVKATMAHEILGHGALRERFPSEQDLNLFLNVLHDKFPALAKLTEQKKKFFDEGHETNVEEVLANMVNNKAIVKDGDNFKTKSLDELYANDEVTLKSIVNTIKSAINTVSGKEIFKLAETDRMQIQELRAYMKKIGEDMMTSPSIKKGDEYVNNPKVSLESKILSFKFMRDPSLAQKVEYETNIAERLWEGLKRYNYSKLGNMSGQAQINKVFAPGFDNLRSYSGAAKNFATDILSPIRSLYGKKSGLYGALGGRKGLSAFDEGKATRFAIETEGLDQRFTPAELTAKGASPAQVKMYEDIWKMADKARDYEAKTGAFKIFHEARENFVDEFKSGKVNELLAQLENHQNYDTPTFFKEIHDFLDGVQNIKNEDNFTKLEKALDRLEANHAAKENYLPRINSNGDFYLVKRDASGKPVEFKQFTSEAERNIVERKMKAVLKEGEKIEPGNTKLKSDSKDASKKITDYASLQEELKNNGVHFDVIGNLSKYADEIAKESAGNIHITKATDYIHSIQEKFPQEARDLAKLRDDTISPSSEILSKIKMMNTLAYLGFSPAGAVVNMFGLYGGTLPNMVQYKGGVKNFGEAHKYMLDTFKSAENFLTSVTKDGGYFKGNEAQAKRVLKQAIDAGVLEDLEISDLKYLGQGLKVGSNMYNAKTVAVNAIMTPMKYSEGFNRKTTAITALKTALENADKLNLKTDADFLKFVQDTMDATQGNYSKEGRPVWARKWGNIGELVYQFKTYPLTQVQTMISYIKKGEYQAAATMGLMWIALAGAGGIPFMEDAEDFIDTIGQGLGFNPQSKEFINQLDNMGAGGQIFNRGFLDYAGIPLGARLGMQDLLPGSSLFKASNPDRTKSVTELAGPTASTVKNTFDFVAKAGSSIKKAVTGKGELNDIVETFKLSPLNTLKNIAKGVDAGITGKFTDSKGTKLSDASFLEAFGKGLGFQKQDINVMYREMQDIRSNDEALKYFKGKVNNEMARGMAAKDDEIKANAKMVMNLWNERNPSLKFNIDYNIIGRKLTAMKQDSKEKFAKSVDKSLRQRARKVGDEDDEDDE